MTNLIIGKNSNLSNALVNKMDNVILVSSREITENIDSLLKFKSQHINLIFNNFQPAVMLNDFSSFEKYISNSIGNTAKILDFCSESKVNINKIIYTSSSSVYGNNILCNEQDELQPLNLQASLKVSNEKMIENYCLNNNIDYTIARIFNMYGGNDQFSIISKIIKAYKLEEELTIVNNGNAVRDFIHIDDVVAIYLKLLKVKKVPYINIGTGEGSSVKNILDFLKNSNVNIKTKKVFKNELKISTADTSLLSKQFNYKNFISIEQYLEKEFNL
ncbi:NAD-dependent epimerase/dehydratase family protein [Arcobacter sp.]|uniref:NAD-dependent epimerase/dehydratase family protein n=1 Tax=Arcobacter sp. TaxID=1872629 RepID=UPI003D124AB8